jgi:hypothetical protein
MPPSKKLGACRGTLRPPHLDGRLDEPIWDTADRLLLSGSTPQSAQQPGEGLAEVRLLHDDEFFYVAIHCLKVANVKYEPDDRPRTHDADLVQHDRVSLALDIDRDYTTAFEFTVDDRGWTYDACWGDATWNPTWYVANAADENSWTVEAAIPMSELVDRAPAVRDIWAVSIRRTIPRTGYQSWAGPVTDLPTANSPNQFGLLIFEPAAAATPSAPASTPAAPQ